MKIACIIISCTDVGSGCVAGGIIMLKIRVFKITLEHNIVAISDCSIRINVALIDDCSIRVHHIDPIFQ